MAEMKTKPTKQSVEEFLNGIPDEKKREDAFALLKLMKQATRKKPTMWGPSMVGFGSYHYCYDSGREGDWFLTGFSPRKQNLTVYIMTGFDKYSALLKKLGKFTTAKSCLYIKKLDDVDPTVLKELVKRSAEHIAKMSKQRKPCA
jgi:hypothetical protein